MFIARGKEDALVTYNLVIGESVYGEKRISVEVWNYFLCSLLSDVESELKRKSLYTYFDDDPEIHTLI